MCVGKVLPRGISSVTRVTLRRGVAAHRPVLFVMCMRRRVVLMTPGRYVDLTVGWVASRSVVFSFRTCPSCPYERCTISIYFELNSSQHWSHESTMNESSVYIGPGRARARLCLSLLSCPR